MTEILLKMALNTLNQLNQLLPRSAKKWTFYIKALIMLYDVM